MNREDPIDDVLAQLPQAELEAQTAARVGRRTRAVFVRQSRPLARFDDWTLGRVVPAVLLVSSVAYLVGLVHFFGATY